MYSTPVGRGLGFCKAIGGANGRDIILLAAEVGRILLPRYPTKSHSVLAGRVLNSGNCRTFPMTKTRQSIDYEVSRDSEGVFKSRSKPS